MFQIVAVTSGSSTRPTNTIPPIFPRHKRPVQDMTGRAIIPPWASRCVSYRARVKCYRAQGCLKLRIVPCVRPPLRPNQPRDCAFRPVRVIVLRQAHFFLGKSFKYYSADHFQRSSIAVHALLDQTDTYLIRYLNYERPGCISRHHFFYCRT